MTSNLDITEARDNKDAVLVVTGSLNGDSGWVDQLRSRYPEWTVTQCRTFLSGIAEAARKPFRAILAGVDSSLPKLERAVAGLREAAGPETRLLLCCTPDLEPLARNAMAGGADDYLVHPLDLDELDTAVLRALAEAEARRQAAPDTARARRRPKELGGRKGLEPTRFGDWEKDGIASDF